MRSYYKELKEGGFFRTSRPHITLGLTQVLVLTDFSPEMTHVMAQRRKIS